MTPEQSAQLGAAAVAALGDLADREHDFEDLLAQGVTMDEIRMTLGSWAHLFGGDSWDGRLESKDPFAECPACDRRVRLSGDGTIVRHLGPAGWCKGEDFPAPGSQS